MDRYGYTNSPNVITPQALAPQTPINLAGTTPTPTVDTSLVANATQGTQAFDTNAEFQRQLELQKQTTPDQTPLNDILKQLTLSEQNLGGMGEAQLTAEANAGIPEAQKRRATLQGTIKTQLAEYEALKTEFERQSAELEAGAGRKGLTTGAVMGQQGAIDRAKLARLNSKASEIGIYQAQDEALKGDIEAAQKTVDRAIDLKYKDRESENKIKQAQYDRIKDSLTAEETKRGKALEEALKKEEKALTEAKENEKAIEKMLLDATPNAPADVIASANNIKENGGSALEVAQALGKYGGDYLKTERLKQQIETEKAQRSNIYANIAKTKKETAAIGADGTKLTADEKKAQTASSNLVGLLDTYKKEIEGISFMQANSPAKRTAINSLKGRITAEYKQAKQLGTLDAGVQKLIDSIIPNPGDFSISSLDNKAQVKAIDDFRKSFEVADPVLDSYFNAATGSIQTVNNQINNKEKSFLNSL